MHKPVVILSAPQMGENIGAVARIMSNFGVDELRIVNPRDGWPNEKAQAISAHGSFVLDQAKIYDSLQDAIADRNIVYGTASLERFMVKSVITPWEMERAEFQNNKVGFLFGCEKSGLTNDELSLCDAIIRIPTSAKNHSLNIAQAVAILLYEYMKFELGEVEVPESPEPASKEEVVHLISFLENNLDELNFFKSPNMKPTMMRNITNMLVKAKLSQQDARTLFGIFRAMIG